ncbi:ABC transporter permease [Paenibacillus pasadenensis]|uniref:Alkanesulfonates transport system permease protein n=1 Tax=Paenibacillus pasadenensis TaxID=217090 RepID=A0A2N5N283_9BACL|nr:ABC transporter permease [Paenibacillus pasadenensis]PLT44440.1 Alkanesulfonates transport system permease protein [Paenibacillus pasadenensis]
MAADPQAAKAQARAVTAPRAEAARQRDWLGLPRWAQGWLLPLAVLLVWEAAARAGLVSPAMLPAPSVIAASALRLLASGELGEHAWASFRRAAAGFLLGGATGLLLGLFTGLGRWAQRLLDPSLQMLRTVPLLAVIPLFILWFGVGEFSKGLLIALGAFFPVYFHTYLGVRSAEAKLYEVTRVLQFTRLQLVRGLILPAALPNILLGARLSAGVSWLMLSVAEMMGASEGIGYMIQDARVYAQTDLVFVGIVLFMLAGKLTDAGVRRLELRWLRWRRPFQDGKEKGL